MLSTIELDKHGRHTGKYKTEAFDSVKEREAFAKKRLETHRKIIKDLQQKSRKAQAKMDTQINNWTKNWFEKNTKNFKVGNYDDAIAQLAKDWAVESKKAIYQPPGVWKRAITTESGLPILRNAKIFGMGSVDMVRRGQFVKGAQERILDRPQAYYKRVFHSGLLKNSKLRNNVKDFMIWAAKDKTGAGGHTLLAKASNWLTDDTIKLMGEIDASVLPSQSRGDILRYHFPKTASRYLERVNIIENLRKATITEVEKLAGVESGYIKKALAADRNKLRKIFNTEKLPLAFKYSGDHLLGLREAQILGDKNFAKQAVDNLIGRTFAQNSELGWGSFGSQRRDLTKEFANPKTTPARKAKIVERLNILSDEFIPGEVEYKLGAKNNLIAKTVKQTQSERYTQYAKTIAKTEEGAAAIKKQHGNLKNLLKKAKNTPKGPGRLKIISTLIQAGVGLHLLNKYGISSAEAKTLETGDETQEASVIGDVAQGAGAIALGTAVVHPKETGELAKKVLTKAGKILAKPIALTALPVVKGVTSAVETGKAIKEKRLPDYNLTDPLTWVNAGFWDWAVKTWGWDKTVKNFGESLKTLSTGDKARVFRNVVARAGLSPKAVQFISSRVAWPVAGIMSVHDAYKDYQERKPDIEKQKELIKEGVIKEEEFDKEEPMFAMGGIASLIK